VPEPVLRLLMPSAGRKVALMRALEKYFKVYPAGLAPKETASCCLAGKGRFVELPRSGCCEFDNALLAAIERIGINVVLPVRNEDMLNLWALKERIQGVGAKLVMSPPETLACSFDKLSLHRNLTEHGFHTPYTVTASDWHNLDSNPFPLFVKDRFGSGSRLAQRVRTPEELGAIMVHCDSDKLVVQPFIEGQEYTLDMFFNEQGTLKQWVLRKRLSVLNGQMDSGEVMNPGEFELVYSFQKVIHLGDYFKFVGPINVQFIMAGNTCYITDVNPRFSGGVGLTIAAGADFPAYLLELVSGGEVQPRPYKPGPKAISYTEYVYG
jgi:carbamoyl-phosphate synthase large subunit